MNTVGGSSQGPPLVVGFYPLAHNASAKEVIESLQSFGDEVIFEKGAEGIASPSTVVFSKFKSRFTLMEIPNPRNDTVMNNTPPLVQGLDAVTAVDILVLVMNVSNGLDEAIDSQAHEFLSAVKATGTPSVVGAIQGVSSVKNSGKSGLKKANEYKKHATNFFESEFPKGRVKVADVDDMSTTLRVLSTVAPKVVAWRHNRPYVVSNGVEFTSTGHIPVVPKEEAEGPTEEERETFRASRTIAPNTVPSPEAVEMVKKYLKETGANYLETGTLQITGFIRGAPLSTEQYVYLCGIGYYPISKVVQKEFTGSINGIKNNESVDTQENHSVNLEELKTVAPEETMAGEQTWPTEEEEKAAESRIRRPTGGGLTTEYTKAWLTDKDEIDEETKKEEEFKALNRNEDVDDAVSDAATSVMTGNQSVRRPKPRTKKEEEHEDSEFPDEIDTPMDVPARERFGRYRGLQSFRTSFWDPKESLPRSYSRIFQVQNYSASSKRAVNELKTAENELFKIEKRRLYEEQKEKSAERKMKRSTSGSRASESGMDVETDSVSTGLHTMTNTDVDENLQQRIGETWVPTGRYVMIEIPNVPLLLIQQRNKRVPLVITGLLRHEHQTSVVHFNVQRVNTEVYNEPIKSKDELEFHCGFLRFNARPIFGENNLKSDKHKFERFLHPNRWTVASAYAPMLFGSMPVQVFKRIYDESNPEVSTLVLVATGTVLSADPDRIILKKIVLSGYPIKVNRRAAVVKYMFFNPEDILWFKPIELHTKQGLTGYIKEPVGTHGRMKCTFSGAIKQHDTVLMSLYKRVYPRWGESYRHLVGRDLMDSSVGQSIAGGAGVNRGGNADIDHQGPRPHPLDQFMLQQKQEQSPNGDIELA